jgi:hypothetical protein
MLLVDALGSTMAWKGDSNWMCVGRGITNASYVLYISQCHGIQILWMLVPSSVVTMWMET